MKHTGSADGSVNPEARGFLVTDAEVGLIQKDGTDGALYACCNRNVECPGIDDLSVVGTVSVREYVRRSDTETISVRDTAYD